MKSASMGGHMCVDLGVFILTRWLTACYAGVLCSAGSAGWAAGRRCALAVSAAKKPWVHFGPPKSGIVRG
eukprot:725771-Prymnesium_polylepis.1